MAIGNHHTTADTQDEWLTPPWILEDLGPFDLDPCAPVNRPWDMAKNHYTIRDDGLNKQWFGRIWLNPPYDHKKMWNWFNKLWIHGDGIALIFARTETSGFFRWVWEKANAVFFIKGRLYFHYPDGSKSKANSGGPSVLIAYGSNNIRTLKNSNIQGKFIELISTERAKESRQPTKLSDDTLTPGGGWPKPKTA